MTQIQKVPFQKWRLFWQGVKFTRAASAARDAETQQAYHDLVDLTAECIHAVDNGKQALMIEKLDALMGQPREKDVLAEMLAGTHKDVPEWLRKDR